MNNFTYKEMYIEDGKRILEVNILAEKHCNFDCIFCTLGRTTNKMDNQKAFDNFEEEMKILEKNIDETKAELLFINSKGEAFINDNLEEIINFAHRKGLEVRLFSNGYLLGENKYIKIANKCEEVVGEIKIVNEEKFQKAQRPINGYTVEKYVENMISFSKQFIGNFIFEVTIIKNYSDDKESINYIKEIIEKINPYKTKVLTMEEEIFKKKLAVNEENLILIKNELLNK